MDTRRDFIKKAGLITGGTGLLQILPASIAKALAINPAAGTTFMDAEHIVFLMQENRSFDHAYGTLQGVRGFNDPRAIRLPNNNPVWLQSNKAGETFAPFRFDIKATNITWMHSLPHSWSDQVDARNNGNCDKWLDSKASGHKEYKEMPLTMGFYSREDIPFYYSLADAFTVCDQNFCSSLTGTTPNRLYFWSGTIREKPDPKSIANVWNDDADYDTMVNWKTFPERLEENGVSWKVYQNELSVGVGFDGEEDGWLANFTDNPLEFFTQYQVKLSAKYIDHLPKAAAKISEEIKKREQQLSSLGAGAKEADALKKELEGLKKQLQVNAEDQKIFTKAKYDQLSQREKNIHDKAFSTNSKDPFYHELTTLKYKDGDTNREVRIPKGDILHEFREDVKKNTLPTVSWLVAPANFSDHPGSAWYGAWYISEVMDILTKDPETWKKTIFILTYDENDGYFDHVPPFVPPHPDKKDTGLVSKGIDTAIEYVADASQQTNQRRIRKSPIGLGYRVPMVIASPWSRGGWVNSEVFDHTSSLRFLEKFLSKKFKKNIEETNISAWRRAVCGDLSSVFRPYNGEKLMKPEFLDKEEFVESIHKAQFKNPPSNFKKLSSEDLVAIHKNPIFSSLLPEQEKGIRASCALPYELYADGNLRSDKASFQVAFKCGDKVFGAASAGSPFQVYGPGSFSNDQLVIRDYAAKAGDGFTDQWSIADFPGNNYHLKIYGPNGFFREYKGNKNDPELNVQFDYEREKSNPKIHLTGNASLAFQHKGTTSVIIEITDNAYKAAKRSKTISKSSDATISIDTSKSFGWYDITVRIKGNSVFEKRYAGRVETGRPSKTDPFMGRVI